MSTLKNMTVKNTTLLTSALLTLGLVSQAHESPLKLDVYNPVTAGIFPVSSVLVTGKKDAILIDAQFGKSQAEKVVEKIKASGKTLTTIYISHGDPDYYFGLDTIKTAFPNAKVLAAPQTVAHIKETVEGKKAYWDPILAADAPT
jgi:glyoxylase-like metal-dependent hydrolase (beta-lactamase superfamily II)